MDEWCSVPGHPGYEISSTGQLRYGDVIIRSWVAGNGYRYVRFYKTLRHVGARFERTIHSLVCEAFHGPKPTPRHEVRHLNGYSLDNAASNLAWGTPRENRLDSVRHGTHYFSKSH
jgi:hypothetical protein